MLPRLPPAIKPRLELPLTRRYHQHPHICLTRPHNHIRHVVLMPRCVQNRVPLLLRREMGPADFHGFSLGALFLIRVHDEGEEPTFAVSFFGFAFVPFDRAFVHVVGEIENVAGKGGFASVDVAYEYQVQVLARVSLHYILLCYYFFFFHGSGSWSRSWSRCGGSSRSLWWRVILQSHATNPCCLPIPNNLISSYNRLNLRILRQTIGIAQQPHCAGAISLADF
mmetsp:Transcript_40800/g.49686  ORF Transcript_40800/g.49686 Transcript_40800/m.49686 type:complete len:224 (+) Transcript_40800:1146-1817(+)